jgi:lysophospholipase L1-like esterase
MDIEILFVVDSDSSTFRQECGSVDVVCVGDSITGWNNYGPAKYWPFPTYPRFLQELCRPLQLRLADGGIAGEVSDNGLAHVNRYLRMFPSAKYHIVGFGTNDLGIWPSFREASKRIIDNLGQMIDAIENHGAKPILFNVPHVNESAFPPAIAQDARRRRDYHNPQLAQLCQQRDLPLVDICSHLRDEHFGDELHPNEQGARIIADEVFRALHAEYRKTAI